jgi:NAD(P)-dependent dehydrogenase (short-subunit alcohol dehydrogenase family)
MGMLEKKVAFVTGAASGIGAGMARRFVEEGALVALADVNVDDGERMRSKIDAEGKRTLFLECDVSDPESVNRAIAATVERFGGLDIVCANAGINGVWAPVEELKPEEWERTLDINLKGTFLTVRYAVPHLKRKGGSIIITSSVNGTRTFSNPGTSAYSTSKAGQVAFMKTMALELGRHNIRCNAICPGYVETNIGESTEQRHTEKIGIEVKMPKGSPAIDQEKVTR